MKFIFTQEVDMSSQAVDQRLQDLGQIYQLAMSLQGAKFLGKTRARLKK